MGTAKDTLTTTKPADVGSADLQGRTITITLEPGHTAVVNRVVQVVERSWKQWKHDDLPGVGKDSHGDVAIPSGLVPTLVQELVKDGYRVDVRDHRSADLDADVALFDQVEGADRRYLEALVKNPLGIVEVNDNADLIARLTQLVALYPSNPVVVTVATRKLAWKVWRTLGEHLNHPVGLVTASMRKPGRRCVVCSYRMLRKLGQVENAILAVIEAERAVQVIGDVVIGNPVWSRLYGFVYADMSRDEHADLCLRALAGELIHATASTARPKRVLMVPVPQVPMKSGGRGLERKRRTIWKNRPRNRRIARVALALLAQDIALLQECGIHLDAHELNDVQRVAVLVESTAHARELRSLLNGWPVHDMVPLEMKKPHAMVDSQDTLSQGSIVTVIYGGLEGVDADVIVRATGGSGTWLVEDSLEEKLGEKTAATLIIDFADNCDQQARNDTKRRTQDYRNRRWAVEGVPALG